MDTQYKVSAKTADFLNAEQRMPIGMCWHTARSGKTFPVINPADEQVLAQVPCGDKEDIDIAVKCARLAFEKGPWSKMKPSERGRLLWKLADLIESHAGQFAEIESLDNGKPKSVALAVDVPLSADIFRYMAGFATKLDGSVREFDSDFLSVIRREPIGVVGQIIPWNFPLLMAAWKLAPALATGCTVVLKPAEQTPLSALYLDRLIREAEFPAGVVNIVTGYGHTAGAALAAHPDVDKVAFTGSTEVGRRIVLSAGESNLKKISLELGGKSPNIIFPDADLDRAIPGAANAIFFNHGQCCSAGSRLYAHKSVFDKVVAGVADIAKNIRLGHGLDSATDMGPLVSEEQFRTVYGYVQSGVASGAEVVCGGASLVGKCFMKPTILTNVAEDMKVVREEIFGPVVTVMPFDDINDEIAGIARAANSTRYGLAAGIWTKDLAKAQLLARVIKAGTVWINCYNVFDAALPFGGYKESGWGREMGHEVLDLYTQTKAITMCLK
ncbi:MAG: aldehyde dehydrogenase family protein [Parcubacteria group bacterium]|nr:aldehyde dehydrogenase family protein [Parcubacteria group bacterium]